MDPPPIAIGRLEPGGPWVGFARDIAGRYLLVVGTDDGPPRRAAADHDLLLALAIAYYSGSLAEPPPELEATQADLGLLVRDLAAAGRDPAHVELLRAAVDAIDDGLAADAVVSRLQAASAPDQADPIERLVARARALAPR